MFLIILIIASQFAQLFLKLKDDQPKFRHQIVAIAGDCSQPNLGMFSQDRDILIREVSIVFHVAATVRFDEKLKLAMAINVRSARDILYLCKEITNLKVSREKAILYTRRKRSMAIVSTQ